VNKLSSLGMLYDHIRPEERLLIDTAKRKGIKLELYDAEDIFFDALEIENAQNFPDTVLQRCISYFRSINLSALLESRSINVINSSKIASLCGNKLLATLTLAKEKIPTPKTFIAFTIESALNALSKIGYPAVIKPIIGSWGRLVAPLKDPESTRAILEDRDCMFPVYQVYYLQEMIERPSRDMRCFIIDDKAVAAIYRYSGPDDWRTNTARGGRVEDCKITAEIEDISIKAAKAFGDGIFGVDIMESPRGLLVHEVNYTTEFRNSVPATGVDIPGLILDYAMRRSKK
jgi:[lysine-biosynthesis-protein LysW]--L-2-aminoadipate ligase